MKECSTLSKLTNLFVALFILTTLTGCRDNSIPETPMELPKMLGNFPLKEYWRKNFDSDVKAMALGSGALITGTINNNGAAIQAFGIAGGSSLWKSDLPGNSIGMNITVWDDFVYIIFAPKLFALDLGTGNIIFEADIGASGIDKIATITNKNIFVVKVSQGVFAYDRLTGKSSWQVLVGRGPVGVFSDTTQGLVYIVHGEYLRAVNAQDGSIAWQNQIGFSGSAEYHDGILYYSTSGTAKIELRAFNLKTKSQLWATELTNEVDCIASENNDILMISTRTAAMVEAVSGKKAWDYYIPLGAYCPPVIMNNVIYIKNGANNQVIAMQQQNGNILGRLGFG